MSAVSDSEKDTLIENLRMGIRFYTEKYETDTKFWQEKITVAKAEKKDLEQKLQTETVQALKEELAEVKRQSKWERERLSALIDLNTNQAKNIEKFCREQKERSNARSTSPIHTPPDTI